MKIGIIGMGIRGNLFARAISEREDLELVGISDINEKKLKVPSKQYKTKGYIKYEELLQKGLDAVIVTTPDFAHKEPVISAAEHKTHILVEKPFATSVEDCKEMKRAVIKGGVKCMVAFENRWNLPFVEAKKIIERGEIGDIISINSKLNDLLRVPTQVISWSNRTSPAWFLLSHAIDLACWYCGEKAIKVYATGVKKKLISMGINNYDLIHAMVRYNDRVEAMFEACWTLPNSMASPVDFKYEIVGTRGVITIDTFHQMISKCVGTHQNPMIMRTEEVQGQLIGFPVFMLNSFINDLKRGKELKVGLEEGIQVTRIIAAIHKSIDKGEPVFIGDL